MSKKVLVLSNMYPTKEHKTFGVFVKNQVEALRNRGVDVDVIAIFNPKNGKFQVLRKYGIWFGKALLTSFLKGRSYNVVHAHYVFPTGLLALLFKKLAKVPYVVTAHGGDIDKMAKKNPKIREWTKRILHGAEHVIAVGHVLKKDIIVDFGISEEKISVLNMGVNRSVFIPRVRNEVREALGLDQDRQIILFVGNIIIEKGVAELIQAFGSLQKINSKPVELHLIGASRQPAFQQELLNLIENESIKHVTFHQPLPQNELAKWMAAADVFVLPSYIEGFGLVALEAMSCHTPVVASDVGGLSHLLEGGAGILVPPKSTEELSQAIHAVLNDSGLGQSLIEHGERKAQENDEEIIVNELLQIYDQI